MRPEYLSTDNSTGNPQLSPASLALLDTSLIAAEAAYETGDALGEPARCFVALEIDYNLEEDIIDAQTPVKQYQDRYGRPRIQIIQNRSHLLETGPSRIHHDLTHLIPSNTEEAERQARWLSQVDGLTLPELVTYFVYKKLSLPTLANIRGLTPREPADYSIMEFTYGPDIHQDGYYDKRYNPESQTVPRSPSEALDSYDRILAAFGASARKYGLTFNPKYCQINFSVQDSDGRTVHTLEDTAGQAIATRTAAHMLIALRDIAPVRLPYLTQHAAVVSYRAGPTRADPLRVLPGRYEYRYPSYTRSALQANILAMMGGFAQGFRSDDMTSGLSTADDERLTCQIVPYANFVPAAGFNKATDLHILRVLQHSHIEDGSLTLGADYAEHCGVEAIKALFGSKHAYSSFSLNGVTARNLIRTFRFDSDQKVNIDPTALHAWWQSLESKSRYAIGYDTPHSNGPRIDLLLQRLQLVEFAGNVPSVRSSTLYDRLTTIATWHQALARLAGSAALQPALDIPSHLHFANELGRLYSQERAATHAVNDELMYDIGQYKAAAGGNEELPPDLTRANTVLLQHLDNCNPAGLLAALHYTNYVVIENLEAMSKTGSLSAEYDDDDKYDIIQQRRRVLTLRRAWNDHLVSLAAARGIRLS